MSGICGQFNLDEGPVDEYDLRSMSAMLAQRGPDACNCWRKGSLGLGHTLLVTTPELLFESQPFEHSSSGCVISADVRLDNRDELLSALAPNMHATTVGDAELILLAYLAWDEQCLLRVHGDFAFAIWDPRQQRLFCGRDRFGMRPFYYHFAERRRFVFASSCKAITVLPQVPYSINTERVADYLVSELEWVDYTSTFFENVHRLPPAHQAVVSASGIVVSEYWQPSPGPSPGVMSDDDYKHGLLEVLTQSVATRLRAPSGTVGAMLSGGMDSGSVVAIAREMIGQQSSDQLATYSAIGEPGAQEAPAKYDETKAIRASIEQANIKATLIDPITATRDSQFMLVNYEEPFDTGFMFLKAIFGAASNDGIRVLLDGGGGDVVLGEGAYIVNLIRRWQLKRAFNEIVAENSFCWGNKRNLLESFARNTGAAVLPQTLKNALRGVRHQRRNKQMLNASLISREFASDVDILSRFEQLRKTYSIDTSADYASQSVQALRPNVTGGRERYARIAASTASEARDPFLDLRVVQFCAHLPGHLRLRDGMAKFILRDVMSDRVPHEVAWQPRKLHVAWQFNQALNKQLTESGALTLESLQNGLVAYVDPTKLQNEWQSFVETGYSENINTALNLSTWLRENEKRPVVQEIGIL